MSKEPDVELLCMPLEERLESVIDMLVAETLVLESGGLEIPLELLDRDVRLVVLFASTSLDEQPSCWHAITRKQLNSVLGIIFRLSLGWDFNSYCHSMNLVYKRVQ